MRKFFYVAISCLFTLQLSSQNFLEKNCKHLLENEKSTRVTVTGKMFEMISTVTKDMKDEDLKQARKIFSKIKSFELVSMEDLATANQEIKNITSKTKNYEPLVVIKDKQDNVSVLIREKNGIIYELVGYGSSDNDFFAFSLEGELNLEDLKPLTEKLEKESFSPLSSMRGTKMSDVKVYPNPSAKSSNVNIELPENLVGGKMKVFDATGKVITESNITEKTFEYETKNANNYIIMEFSKDGISVTKKVLIVE